MAKRTEPSPISDSETTLSRLLAQAQASVSARVAARLRTLGAAEIRPSHADALRRIDPGGTRISVLAERAGVSKQAMGQFVDEAAALGFVNVTEDKSDRRARQVVLTEKGKLAALESTRAERFVEAEIESEIGRGRMKRFHKRLNAIAKSIAISEPDGG